MVFFKPLNGPAGNSARNELTLDAHPFVPPADCKNLPTGPGSLANLLITSPAALGFVLANFNAASNSFVDLDPILSAPTTGFATTSPT